MTELRLVGAESGQELATVRLDDSGLTFDGPGAATASAVFDRWREAAGEDASDADVFEALAGWSNGYITLQPAGDDLLTAAGDAPLRDHWVRGEGAARIRWGTPGDFDRCVRQLAEHVRDPEGLCAEYHHEAVGKWPGEKSNHAALADEGRALEDVVVLPDGPVVETMPVTFELGEHWHAVANWEDVSTGLRVFLLDALDWREPPFAFHWQWKSSAHGGTPETVHVGSTTRVERDAIGRVHTWGTLDLEDEFGLRYARRLARRTERWVSIGLDESFKEYDIEYVYHQPDVANLDDLNGDDLEVEEMRIGRGRIAELTGVSVPAQAEAVIEPSPQLLEEIMALTAAGGDVVNAVPADGGAVTLELAVDDTIHTATVTPEGAAELAAALRMPPVDGEALDINDGGGGVLNLSRDGDDFYLDLGPEAAILAEADLPGLADAIDAALGVAPEPLEEVVEVVEPPVMSTRPATLKVGDRSLAARVVGPTVEVPGVEVVVASGATEVHTITIPNVPPAEWFAEPTDVTPEGALTITDDGRVFGYLAPTGVAHRSFRNRRVEVPMGNVDYGRWMGGEAIVAGGGRVVAGPITFECGHCDPSGPRDSGKRMEHYDNTCSVAAKAAIGENRHGVWIAGALEPGVSAEQVSRMLACRLSGDWAPHPEKQGMREFVAALLVPVPGFAMGRRAPSTVRVQEGALVAAAVPIHLAVTDLEPVGPDLRPVLDRLAKGIGRDPVSRMDTLRKRVHTTN
jgi:hypothetical protein